MAEIWFYEPRDICGRVVRWVTQGKWSHVGIQHAVTDIAVFTEANMRNGVICTVVTRTRTPDATISIDIPDEWLTRWLVQRWGVRYGWMDALAFAVPSYHKELDNKGVICTELIANLIVDASLDGIHVPGVTRLAVLPNYRISPSDLHDILAPA